MGANSRHAVARPGLSGPWSGEIASGATDTGQSFQGAVSDFFTQASENSRLLKVYRVVSIVWTIGTQFAVHFMGVSDAFARDAVPS